MSRAKAPGQSPPNELLDRLRTFVGPPTRPTAPVVPPVAVPPSVRRLDRILFGGDDLVPVNPGGPDPALHLGADADLALVELAALPEHERLVALVALVQSDEAQRAGQMLDGLDGCLAALPLVTGCLALQLRLADLQIAAGFDRVAAEKLNLLARSYLLRGDRTGFVRACRRLLAVAHTLDDPADFERHARLLAEHGFRQDAAAWWLTLARRRRQDGRPADAAILAERAVLLSPEDPAIAVEHGLALLDLGRRAQAGVLFARALTADPANVAAAAYLLFVSALYDEPLEPLLGALTGHPPAPRPAASGLPSVARPDWQSAAVTGEGAAEPSPSGRGQGEGVSAGHELGPELPLSLQGRGEGGLGPLLDDLLARGEQAGCEDGGPAALRRLLGTLSATAGRVDTARTHLLALADLRARRGDLAGQVEELEQAARLLPDDAVVRRQLGEALLRTGQVARALRELRAAAALEA